MGGSAVYQPSNLQAGQEARIVSAVQAKRDGIVRTPEERRRIKEARRRGQIPLLGDSYADVAVAAHAGPTQVQVPVPEPANEAMAQMIVSKGGIRCPHCKGAFFLDEQPDAAFDDDGELTPEAQARADEISAEKEAEGIAGVQYQEDPDEYSATDKLGILDEIAAVVKGGGGKTERKVVASSYGINLNDVRSWEAARKRGELVPEDLDV